MIVGDCAWWLRKVSSAAVFLCLREVVFVTCQAASDLQSQSTAKCQHQINFFVCWLWSQKVPSDTWWLQKGGKFSSEVVLFFWLKRTSEEIFFTQLCYWEEQGSGSVVQQETVRSDFKGKMVLVNWIVLCFLWTRYILLLTVVRQSQVNYISSVCRLVPLETNT